MAFGTAPRIVNGKWTTRTGRVLNDAGQTYWERLHRAGIADGQGHFDRSKPKPVGPVYEDGSYGVKGGNEYDPQLGKVRPPIVFTARPRPNTARATTAAPPPRKPSFQTMLDARNGDKQAQAERDRWVQHMKLTQQAKADVRAATDKRLFPGSVKSKVQESAVGSAPLGGWGGKLVGGLASDVGGLPVGLALGARHPGRAAAGIAKSFEETATHPLRQLKNDPASFVMNTVGSLSLGEGQVAKLGDIAKAGRSGGLAEAARAAVRPTRTAARELNVDGVTVQRFPSRNRATQRLLRSRDANTREALGKPTSRNVTSAHAGFGRDLSHQYQMRLNQANAPADAFSRFAHGHTKLNPAEEKAFEIIANAHTPETVLQAHLNAGQIAASLGDKAAVKEHAYHASVTKQAAELVRNPSPNLAAALDEARALISKREKDKGFTAEQTARSVGKSHDEIAALAEGRPSLNQQFADAQARLPLLGEQSASLASKRSRVARLQATHDRILEQSAKKAGALPANATTVRPRTRVEGEARLAQLDKQHERLLVDATKKLKGDAPFDPAETARRNQQRARYDRQQAGVNRAGRPSGASSGKVQSRPKTLAQDLRDEAQAQLDSLAEKHSGESWAKAYLAAQDERYQLRRNLEATHPVFGDQKSADFGSTKNATQPPLFAAEHPAAVRMGFALSVAKDELASAEKANATRATSRDAAQKHVDALEQQMIDVGKKAQANGAFYLPKRRFLEMRGTSPAVYRSPGPAGLGPPKIAREKQLTGALQRSGKYRTDVVRLVSDASKQATKERLAHDYVWPTALKLAKDTPEEAGGKYAIPVRKKTEIPVSLREALARPERDTATLPEGQLHALQEFMFPGTTDFGPVVEPPKAGDVKYVDSRMIHGLLSKGSPGFVRIGGKTVTLGDALDSANALPRAATLYAKPSYAWNRAQQAAQNLSQQGWFRPANGRLLRRVQSELPVQDYYRLKAAVRSGRSRSLTPQGGWMKDALSNVADRWGKLTDDTSRELSFVHEARREGFATPQKIHDLLNNPANQAALDRVTIRANHEAIPFGKMSELERRTIGRAFFFYPWTRAAVEWTARFPLEHPVQAAVGTQLGQQGAAETKRVFQKLAGKEAHLPEWARGLLFFQTRGASPLTSDFSNLNTPDTAVQTGQMLANLTRKPTQQTGDVLASELGPGAAVPYALATGTIRGRGAKDPLDAAAQSVVSSTPFATFPNRLKGSKTYPGGWRQALTGYMLGAEGPRKTNVSALAAAGEREFTSQLGPAQKTVYHHQKFREDLFAAAKQSGLLPADATGQPKVVRDAITLRSKRYANYAAHGLKTTDPNYQLHAFQIDDAYLLKTGKITPAQSAKALAWADAASSSELRAQRHKIGNVFFGGSAISQARGEINLAGAKKAVRDATAQLVRHGDITKAQARQGLAWLDRASSEKDVLAELHKIVQAYGLPAPAVAQAPTAP